MSEDNDIKPGDTVEAFEVSNSPSGGGFQWTKAPTHIPPKRPVKVYTIELSDPTLRIATSPTPYKNTLN